MLATPVLIPHPLGTNMNGVFRRTHFVAGSCINEWTTDVGTRTKFRNGTLSHFYLRVSATTLTNTDTVNLRKSGANGNLAVSVPASTTGVFEDLVNSDVFNATGATVAVSHSPTGGTGVTWDCLGAIFSSDSSDSIARFGGGNGSFNAGTGSNHALADIFPITATETQTQFRTATAGTVRYGLIDVSLNSRNGASSFNLRHNTANSPIDISVTASTTGIFEDTTNTFTVAVDDMLGPFTSTVGGSSGFIRSGTHSAELVTTDDTSMVWGVSSAGLANSTTAYIPMMGRANFSGTDNRWKCLCDTPASHLYVQNSQNVNLTASTWRLRINGANGNQVVSIPASSTGYFEDPGNEDTLTENDLVNYQLVTGTGSGQFTLRTVGMLLGPAEPIVGSPGSPGYTSERNLLTGQLHTADGCSDSLLVGAQATVSEAELVALFSLDGSAHTETRDRTFCVYADNICLNGDVTIDGSPVGADAPVGASYVTLATNATLTNERVLTAGTGITLTDAGAGSTITIAATSAGISYAVKSADESLNTSTTLQNDNELVLAVVASAVYEYECVIFLAGGTTGDFKWDLNLPSGATRFGGNHALHPSASGANDGVNFFSGASAHTNIGAIGTGSTTMILFKGIATIAGTAGNAQVQWAQNASDGTNTTVKANSFLRLTRIS